MKPETKTKAELISEIERLQAALDLSADYGDKQVAALRQIDEWSRAYPLSAFPEPDLAKAHELLKAGGMTLDAISASAMRHAVEGVGKIARDALRRGVINDRQAHDLDDL